MNATPTLSKTLVSIIAPAYRLMSKMRTWREPRRSADSLDLSFAVWLVWFFFCPWCVSLCVAGCFHFVFVICMFRFYVWMFCFDDLPVKSYVFVCCQGFAIQVRVGLIPGGGGQVEDYQEPVPTDSEHFGGAQSQSETLRDGWHTM